MTLLEAYNKHRASLLGYLGQIVGDEAEDILQDAWIKASSQPPPQDDNWEPYLITTVRSLALDYNKKRHNRLRISRDHEREIFFKSVGENTRSGVYISGGDVKRTPRPLV